ncbi:MAG: hypothetical protein KGS61_11605, partial [Verrucomicrobia bacterium]|nr:hypothetical protein [Verrucomicrobiota bacterium]
MAAGVVARGLAAGVGLLDLEHQRLEDFAEHLRVNGHVLIEWRVLANREVVGFEKFVEDVLEHAVADLERMAEAGGFIALLRAVFVGKQPAVQEGQIVPGDVGHRTLSRELDEQRLEEFLQIRRAVLRLAKVLPEVAVEEVAVAVEPALALDEVEEKQAVKQGLSFALDVLGAPEGLVSGDVFADQIEHGAEISEEPPRHRLNVKGCFVPGADGERAEVSGIADIEQGQALGGGAVAFVRAELESAKNLAVGHRAVGGLDVDQMRLRPTCIAQRASAGEHEQRILERFQQLGGEHTLPPVVQPVAVQFGVDDMECARLRQPDGPILLRKIKRGPFTKCVLGNRDGI